MKIKEKDIFLLLTNKCNLQCFACGYGCEDKNNNWFISEEQFITALQKIKNTNLDGCNNYVINLTGGDPMLHKDWKKFAFLTRETIPNATCFISTSGPILATLEDHILIECYNKQIYFGLTLYPSTQLLPMYIKIEEKFKRLGILNSLSWNPMRIIFSKPTINTNRDILKCFDQMFTNNDYCFIYNDRLYNCQNLFYQDMKNKNIQSSYNIYNIFNNQNLKNISTKKDCEHCKITFHESVFWNFNKKIPKHCLFTPLKELFLYDYNNYYTLQHDCEEHLKCLQHNFFKKYYSKDLLHPIAQIRFFLGKADIFIPYNTYIDVNFFQLLKEQTDFEKYNFYFLSYTNNLEIDSFVYDNCYIPQKNIFFLKEKNYLNTIHTFLKNSYLNKKYCLDINNFECLKDKNFLNNIIGDN